jgi:signal transduction histidine kinase
MNQLERKLAAVGRELYEPEKEHIQYLISQLAQNSMDSLSFKSVKNPNFWGRLRTEVHVGERSLAVRVEDNGMGIDSAVEPHLFTFLDGKPIPSSRRKAAVAERLNVEVRGKEGMGLYQIKKFTKKMGGSVFHFDKGPERGAIFGFTVPLSAISVLETKRTR